MFELNIFQKLSFEFPDLISNIYPFPKPFSGTGKIKAIILGADPTHIVSGQPQVLTTVFELDNPKSPYWRSIARNIAQIPGLNMKNVYVQNVCRNYFTLETSKNNHWEEIAREYWIPFLKNELDDMFDPHVPILMTTEFILNAALKDPKKRIPANELYSQCKTIAGDENLFGRELFGFYRHYAYSLDNWGKYSRILNSNIIRF
jgi:hypothetical protein